MTDRILETDVAREALDAAALIDREIARLDESLHAWKWIVVGAHSVVQGVMVACISDSHLLGALRPKIAAKWLEANESRRSSYPREELDAFPNLWARTKEKTGYAPSVDVDRDVERLNRFRNDFVHYLPRTWLIEVSGFPELIGNCLRAAHHLGWGQPVVDWGLDRSVVDAAESSLKRCIASLEELEAAYGDA